MTITEAADAVCSRCRMIAERLAAKAGADIEAAYREVHEHIHNDPLNSSRLRKQDGVEVRDAGAT
jgi:hypothetical protein